MPIGTSKIGAMGGVTIVTVPAGSCTLNSSGTFVVPTGVNTVNVTAEGGNGNPGNPGNAAPGGGYGGGGGGGAGGTATGSPANPTWKGIWGLGGKGAKAFGPKGGNGGNYSAPCNSGGSGNPGGQGAAGATGNPGTAGTNGNATQFAGLNFAGGTRGNGGTGGQGGIGGTGGPGGSGRSYNSISPGSPPTRPQPYAFGTLNSRAAGGVNPTVPIVLAKDHYQNPTNQPAQARIPVYGYGVPGGPGSLGGVSSYAMGAGNGGGGGGSQYWGYFCPSVGPPLTPQGYSPQGSQFSNLHPRPAGYAAGTTNTPGNCFVPANLWNNTPFTNRGQFQYGGTTGGGHGGTASGFLAYFGYYCANDAGPGGPTRIAQCGGPGPQPCINSPYNPSTWAEGAGGGGGGGGYQGGSSPDTYSVGAIGAGGGASGNCFSNPANPGNPGNNATPSTINSHPVTPGASYPVSVGTPGGTITICWAETTYEG